MRNAILLRLLVVLPSVLLCLFLAVSLSPAQDPEAGNHGTHPEVLRFLGVFGPEPIRFVNLAVEFKSMAQDFTSFAEVADRELAGSLAQTAMESMFEAEWASDQYLMLSVSCSPYKKAARASAEVRLRQIAERTAIRVKGVNHRLALVSAPAIVQRGGELREKMRELKALLEKPLPE